MLFEKSTSALRRNFNAVLSECRSCLCFFQRHGLALVITNFVSLISVQARKLTHAVTLLSPKSLMTFRGPRRSWQNHIPFRRSFSCNRQNKKTIHRDIKNRREFYSRFKMKFYVTASKFKDGTVCSSIHSLTVPRSIEYRRRYFLSAYLRR